jgi:hypothetical protein
LRQLAAVSASWAGRLNANGVSCSSRSYAGWYHGAPPAWFSASTSSRWSLSIIWRSVGQSPPLGGVNTYGVTRAAAIACTKSAGAT